MDDEHVDITTYKGTHTIHQCFRCHHPIFNNDNAVYISSARAFCHRNWTDCIGYLNLDLTAATAPAAANPNGDNQND